MKTLLICLTAVFIFSSCKKESETFTPTELSEYAPLTVGKFITYNLDSLVYTNFGTVEAHRFYEVKYTVSDSILDNSGRKGFRILRMIRTLPSGTFKQENTFFALNTGAKYEFTENNLKFLKLVQPLRDGQMWKGNSAINVTSLGSEFQYLFDWDYTYAEVGQPKKIGTFNLDNTITINQRDESFNLPVVLPGAGGTPTNIASRDFGQEIYGKGLGLVYKKFLHFEYQLAFGGYVGSGATYTMVAHN